MKSEAEGKVVSGRRTREWSGRKVGTRFEGGMGGKRKKER
jgi:hypothetical protein